MGAEFKPVLELRPLYEHAMRSVVVSFDSCFQHNISEVKGLGRAACPTTYQYLFCYLLNFAALLFGTGVYFLSLAVLESIITIITILDIPG